MIVTANAEALGFAPRRMDDLARRERAELVRRVDHYRAGRPLPSVTGRDVILVDDGLATGVAAEVALRSLRRQDPRRLVLAVPVCAPDTELRLAALADTVVCVTSSRGFASVGTWYEDFERRRGRRAAHPPGRRHVGGEEPDGIDGASPR